MSSFVNDFIINPVLRQARRLSEASRPSTGHGEPDPDADTIAGDGATYSPGPTVVDSPPADYASSLSNSAVLCPDDSQIITSTHPDSTTTTSPNPMEPTVDDGLPRDHLGFPLTPTRAPTAGQIPEDDGKRDLRQRVHSIHSRDLPSAEKARLLHNLLLEGYRASKASAQSENATAGTGATDTGGAAAPGAEGRESSSPPVAELREEPAIPHGPLESLRFWNGGADSPSPAPEKFVLSHADLAPSYAPIRRNKSHSNAQMPGVPAEPPAAESAHPPLGCQHYERNVKLQCATCNKWYPCLLCHDAHEDHRLPRFETRNMLCMLCGTPQKTSDQCVGCGEIVAQYYCGICRLWENRQSKPIYHCNDCGICRRGLGLGKDYVHCMKCCACIPTSIEESHKCIERSTDCNCPICGEYMFTSPRPVVFMTCGHSIHKRCYDQHMSVSYKCPICNKSLANMETQFRNLDVAIQGQPMPAEFRDTQALVLCNDCSGRSTVPYHWLGLKCRICLSYNTVELQILGPNSQHNNNNDEGTPPPQPQTPLYALSHHLNNDLGPGGAGGPGPTLSAEAVLILQQQQQQHQFMTGGEADRIVDASHDATLGGTGGLVGTGTGITGTRRRHSSHVAMTRRPSDLVATSYPSATVRLGPHLDESSDSESEDGIFGLWRGSFGNDEDDSDYVDDSDDMSEDSEEGEEEEEDEDEDEDEEDDDILLIGHR